MGTSDFSILPVNVRANLVWNKGQFLTCAHKKDHSYSLYAFDGFYVEIVIAHDKGGKIEDIVPFRRGYRLYKYARNVNSFKS
jgi:hypothetical protein